MQSQKSSLSNTLYVAYRKIRFLAKNGSLFSLSKPGTYRNVEVPKGTFRIIALNSSMLFLAGYLIVYLLNLFVIGFTAVLFNIPVIVHYYDVDFLIRGVDWTPDSVSGVFSSGPIAMLVLSLFLIILYKNVETETGIMRLLLLWMIFHALTRFFGEILVGAIMSKGFGFVILYMFVMDTGKVILTISGFVAMFATGLLITRMSLYTANIYFNDLLKAFRFKFIVSQFILPFLVGNLVIFLIKLPKSSYFDTSLNISMVLFLIPLMMRSIGLEDFYFDEEPRSKIKLNVILPVTVIIALILFRVIFGFGVRL
jgi:hypothetical protein